jgi:Protein of unknown function (DUF3352).
MTDHLDPRMETSSTDLAPTTAPVVPVVPVTPARRRGRLRWVAAIAVVALVIGTSVAVAVLITGRSSEATVLGYVPDQTVVYGEVRLDLPGDQRRAVGAFLSKFPGFADQAALESKLDQVLDDLIRGASNGDQSYTANIKPWFDGELAFSVGPLPPAASLLGDQASMGGLRALALMSIKDPAAAQAWFDAAVTKNGATTTTETYEGVTLTVFGEAGGVKAAFALLNGKVAVLGDIVSVKAAVDTKGAGSFAKVPGPMAALDSASGDHVGFVYVGLRPLLDWSTELGKSLSARLGGTAATTALSDSMLKVLPEWSAYWLRFESDALVMEATAPKPETVIGPTENRTSPVVEHVPASAVMASVSHDFGKTLKQMLDLYRTDPSFKPILDQLDQGLGLVGGADAAFGWAGDTAIVIDVADGTPQGGLIVAPTDKAAAERLFTALRTFIALGGGAQGITTRDETYNGATITTVDLGDLAKLSGMVGGAASALPLPAGHIEIAYAVTDAVVVMGSGPGFVKGVLDTTNATSLASSERYKKLADRAGNGTGTTFVDITAIRELVEKAAGVADPTVIAKYEKDLKPFLVPFDAMIASRSVAGDLSRSVTYITVK